MEDEVVQILHHSLTEFLLDVSRMGRSTNDVPQFPVIEPTTTHRDIAVACLASLQSNDVFGSYPKDEDPGKSEVARSERFGGNSGVMFNFQVIFLQYPLVGYAARKWAYHARNYDNEDERFFDTLEEFCSPQSLHFRAWLKLMSQEPDSPVAAMHASSLHVAAGFGMDIWAKYLIKNGADIDALDSSENTPLFWAAKGGYREVVDVLIKAGAKLEVGGYDGLTALHIAALRNRAGVVKLLLAAGTSMFSSTSTVFILKWGY